MLLYWSIPCTSALMSENGLQDDSRYTDIDIQTGRHKYIYIYIDIIQHHEKLNEINVDDVCR